MRAGIAGGGRKVMTAGPWLSARGGATLRWGIGADGWARGRSETGALRARGDGLADRWSRVAAAGGETRGQTGRVRWVRVRVRVGPRGPCGGSRLGQRAGPMREKERAGLGCCWVGFWLWVCPFSISLSLLFLIQTSFNSNKNLNSNHTQLKVCTSMNAHPI